MGWNGTELQGGAGGSVTDRPTDRSTTRYVAAGKSKEKKKERETHTYAVRFPPPPHSLDSLVLGRRSGTRLAACGLVTRFLKRISFAPGRRVDNKEGCSNYPWINTFIHHVSCTRDVPFLMASRHVACAR